MSSSLATVPYCLQLHGETHFYSEVFIKRQLLQAKKGATNKKQDMARYTNVTAWSEWKTSSEKDASRRKIQKLTITKFFTNS